MTIRTLHKLSKDNSFYIRKHVVSSFEFQIEKKWIANRHASDIHDDLKHWVVYDYNSFKYKHNYYDNMIGSVNKCL